MTGWRIDPKVGLAVVAKTAESSNPAHEVERALAMGSTLIEVQHDTNETIQDPRDGMASLHSRVGARNKEGKFVEPTTKGTKTYSVAGFVPTGEFHPAKKDRRLHRIIFKSESSTDPVGDMEKALGLGCDIVSVGLNYGTEVSWVREIEQDGIDAVSEAAEDRKMEERSKEVFRSDELIPAYCGYDKKESMLSNPKQIWLKNGMPAIEGTCVSCGRRMTRLGTLA